MKKLLKRTALLIILALFACLNLQAGGGIKLIENKGQWDANILYRGFIPGGCYYLEKNTITYYFYDEAALHKAMHNFTKPVDINCHVVKLHFTDANPNPKVVASKASTEYYNYILGNDAIKYAPYVRAHSKVVLENLWIGIDMEIVVDDEALKYNFIVHPGTKTDKIKFWYEGAKSIIKTEDGALDVTTSLTGIIEGKPVAFTNEKGKQKKVNCAYVVDENAVSFKLGSYNHKEDLVIDPVVIFATYSGSVADNFGFTATYDHQGNAFSGGTVYDVKFPTTTGAFQEKYAGGHSDFIKQIFGRDCGILKYSADGKSLLWCTFIGGSHNEQPHSMVIDRNSNLLILGTTESKNFPVTSGSYDNSYNGNGDIFITSLSKDGSSLVGSTYFGGSGQDGLNGNNEDFPNGNLTYNYGDRFRGEIIMDSAGDAVVATCTRSSDFPLKNNFQTFSGVQDAVFIKMTTDLKTLMVSSVIGGASEDAAYGINVDKNGDYFMCGGTESSDFLNIPGGRDSTYKGKIDGYLIKLSSSGKYIRGTYVGTTDYDQCFFVQLDDAQNVYVYGQSRGNMPVIGNVYSNKDGKQFITCYDNSLKTIVMSTVIGTGRATPDLSPSAFLVDLCGRVCITGWGGELLHYFKDNNNVKGLPITSDAFQSTSEDGSDFYLMVLSRGLTKLVYSTYMGGGYSEEHVDGGTSRFDRDGKVYQSICGGCGGYSDFPTTSGAWSQKNKGKRPKTGEGGCNNALLKMDLNTSFYAPYAHDTTLIITATEELNYSFMVNDFDRGDSVYVSYSSKIFDNKKVAAPTAIFVGDKGWRSIKCNLNWKTICAHASIDTYYVYLNYKDDGCPTPRTSKGLIKIVVKAPPTPKTPGIFCLHRLDNNSIKVEWGDYKTDKYLAQYYLIKRFPNGTTTVLTTFKEPVLTGNFFIDKQAFNHLTTDYRYFIYGANICGTIKDSTREISTIPRKDSIPDAAYLFTVTVENNKALRVIWYKSDRDDFYQYTLMRKKNVAGEDYKNYKYIFNKNDTTFLDEAVDVNKYSYCYKVSSVTQCGIFSPDGNWGCSILLKGDAIPFENHLNFTDYQGWQGGVGNYEIHRREDAAFFLRDKTKPTELEYNDTALNLDWGLYHYKIIGIEGAGGRNATSTSNEITLLQLPIVYVPNVFTPNSDGINDSFNAVHAFVKDYHLRVFNRWGEDVFDTYNKRHSWDGMYRGNKPFNNVFIWQVEYTGWDRETHYKHGNVTEVK
ncbi:MAG: gliding motility-associated C-terminal domain-containing protein [Bacteroidetes bacterium]|nr:gliding motility-associated C-terminal domain-containing protein [Bacteroidota bacterium]